MNKSNKSLLRLFLRENQKLYICLLLLSSTYLVCFELFRIPFFVFIYPSIIFYLLFFFYSIYSYIKARRKFLEFNLFINTDIDQLLNLVNSEELKSIESIQFYEAVKKLENKLNLVRKELNEQNKVIEEDVSTWIHQIKIPITAMKLDLDDVDSNLSRQLKSELFRIELYIEMILNYFRLESTSTDYVFNTVNLEKIVKNELKRFSTEFIKRKIILELNSEEVLFTTDEKWLAFIIDQLLSNALKYTPNYGKITIEINESMIKISDTGIGISANDIPRVFERGYTGYNGRVDNRASGLGLYLTNQVCKNLNIPIKIQSELNEGTTVILNLPNDFKK